MSCIDIVKVRDKVDFIGKSVTYRKCFKVLLVLETRAKEATLVCGVLECDGAPSFIGRRCKRVSFVSHGLYFAFHRDEITDFFRSWVFIFSSKSLVFNSSLFRLVKPPQKRFFFLFLFVLVLVF